MVCGVVSNVAFDFFALDRCSLAKVLDDETAARESGIHRSPETTDALLGLLAVCRRLAADPTRTSKVTQTEAAAVLGLGRSAACKLWKRLTEIGVDPAAYVSPAEAAATGGWVKVGLGEWEAVLHRARRRPRRRFAAVGVVARVAGSSYSSAPVDAKKLGRAGRSHPRALLADLRRSGIVDADGRLVLPPRPSSSSADGIAFAPDPPSAPVPSSPAAVPAAAPAVSGAPALPPVPDRWSVEVAARYAESWVATVGHGGDGVDVPVFEVPTASELVGDGRLVAAVAETVTALVIAEDCWAAESAAAGGPGWRPPLSEAVRRAELLGRQMSPHVGGAKDPVGQLAHRLDLYRSAVTAAA